MEKEISTQIAWEKISKGALFVDVREEDELKQISYDVPNIVNIPLSQFNNRFEELPKDKEIIMVCRGGRRSLFATDFLLSHNFKSVVNMKGGIIQWEADGLPTVRQL